MAAETPHVRHVVDVAQAPWRSLGRVQTELGTRCTGFLVAPRLVMTAAHCLFIRRTGRYIQPGDVHFLWRYAAGAYAGAARAASFTVPTGYDPLQEGATLGRDRAVIVLDTALGAPEDYARLDTGLPAVGTALALGGYNRDLAERVDADTTCTVRAVMVDPAGWPVILHDCAGEPGTSGAPLLARSGAGWQVVGVQVGIERDHQPGGLAAGLGEPTPGVRASPRAAP